MCEANRNCRCSRALDGRTAWTGADCSLRTCPYAAAWVAETAAKANDVHPMAECSNRGMCNRGTGLCDCFEGYDGVACQVRRARSFVRSFVNVVMVALRVAPPLAQLSLTFIRCTNCQKSLLAHFVSPKITLHSLRFTPRRHLTTALLIPHQRQECPEDCSLRGVCFPLEMLAEKFGRAYDAPWDARKSISCLCDIGRRRCCACSCVCYTYSTYTSWDI
jgi:hypothetical protein